MLFRQIYRPLRGPDCFLIRFPGADAPGCMLPPASQAASTIPQS